MTDFADVYVLGSTAVNCKHVDTGLALGAASRNDIRDPKVGILKLGQAANIEQTSSTGTDLSLG